MAEAYRAEEIGGDHDRTTAVFLTQAHPKQTQGSDLYLGTSLDQIHARRFGQDTALPSLELTTESIDRGGGMRVQLPLRVHDLSGLGLSDPAATRDSRAPGRFRAALWRG